MSTARISTLRASANRGSLVVVIPAYNEEKTIAGVIASIPRKVPNVKSVKVLVVDDGSTDGTVKRASGADRVVSHSANEGLGVAFRTGIDAALGMGADIIVNIDADGQFNAADIPKLIAPIARGEAEVVSCSRFMDKALAPQMPWIKKFGNSMFTSMVSFFTGRKFTDTQCGFRAYSREAALRMTLFGRFTYTQEVLLDLCNKGLRSAEVACAVKGQREGKSRVVGHWYSYGAKALIIMLRALRDYKPLKFFGTIGLCVFMLGLLAGVFIAAYWLATGQTSPYTSMITLSALLLTVGFLLIVLSLIADMLGRQRKLLEEMLYELRRSKFEKGAGAH